MVDCYNMRAKDLISVVYNSKGEFLRRYNLESISDFEDVIPDSVGEYMLKAICTN